MAEVHSSKKTKFLIILAFSTIAVIAIWYVIAFLNTPAVGTIRESAISVDSRKSAPDPMKEYSESTYVISAPASYIEKRHDFFDGSTGNVLEQRFFSQSDGSGKKLAITIEKRPQGGISELSSYQFRLLKSGEYVKEEARLENRDIPIFRRAESVYEVTGYIDGYAMVASISVSSAIDTPEKLIGDFSDIAESFRWVRNESQ
jgi:hypothetical protein